MTKYVCLGCGDQFESEATPTKCGKCGGSTGFVEIKNPTPTPPSSETVEPIVESKVEETVTPPVVEEKVPVESPEIKPVIIPKEIVVPAPPAMPTATPPVVDQTPPTVPPAIQTPEPLTVPSTTPPTVPPVATAPEPPAPIEENKGVGESVNFGIKTSSKDMMSLVKMITLPSSATSSPFFDRTVLNIGDKMVTDYAIGQGQTIIIVLELSIDYFNEVWGTGELPIVADTSLNNLSTLMNYDDAAIHVDMENKVIIHNSISGARFANDLENVDQIDTNRGVRLENFDVEKFVPTFPDGRSFDYYATVDVKDLMMLLSVASKFGITYYPFLFGNNTMMAGVGDMTNPKVKGAFELPIKINLEKSVIPSTPIKTELGDILENVIKNLSGEIRIYFAENDFAIWIAKDITKTITTQVGENKVSEEKIFGRIGYAITARVPDEE